MKNKKKDFVQRAMANHSLIFFLLGVFMVMGVWSLIRMKKNEFPEFTIPKGLIVAVYPGATAQEIEMQVTQPLEEFLFTYPEINKRNTYSETKDGMVYIYVDIQPTVKQTDILWAKVRAGLSLFKLTTLPAGVLDVVVIDDFGTTSSILLTMSSDRRTPRELQDYSRELSRRLRTIPEMGNIKVLGQQNEEICVEIDPARLSQYGIDQKTILSELSLQGFRTLGATLPEGNTMVQVEMPILSEAEVGDHIVYSNPLTGAVVRLKDVATVQRRYPDREAYVDYYSGGTKSSCVILDIQVMAGKNIVEFGDEVDAVLDRARADMPSDIRLNRIVDQPKVVDDSVLSFLRDILLSLIVVIAVMLLLFPLKTALVAGIGVPICMVITFALMYLTDIELNTVTLAALIVVLGMIVDNAVIVVDGYSNYLEQGYSRWYSASVSTKELFVPMLVATLSISGMFFPMTKIMTGIMGDFCKLFPWTIFFSLLVSLFYAVWVAPYLSTRLIRRQTASTMNAFEKAQNKFFEWLQAGYKWLLTVCFKLPWATICLTFGLLGLGVFLFTRLNVQMFPKADRNSFAVEIHLKEGSDVRQTAALSDSLAGLIAQDKRVVSITNLVGITSPRFHAAYTPQVAAPNYAQFIVLTESSDATVGLLKDLTPRYENYFPDAYVRFKQLDYQIVKNPVEIYIKGDDYDRLAPYADSVKRFLASLPETQWVHDDYSPCVSTAKISLKPDEARQMGVTQTLLSLYLNSSLGGQTLTTIWEGEHKVPVILYSQDREKVDCQALGDQMIPTAFPGVWVPLRQVADVSPQWHHTSLTRWNGERTITVGCDLRGETSQPAVQKKLEKWVKENFKDLPADVHYSYGGLTFVNNDSIPSIIMSVLAALAVMFAVLLYHFRKVSISLLTLSSSILVIFGAFLGLYVFGLDFSISAVLGVVALIGVIVRNAIMMFEYADNLRFDNHLTVKEAAYQSGLRRMRPIFLTSATTALGVIPMIAAHTGLWMPLGVVILLGTFFTLPLTLTFLPVAYWKVYASADKKKHAK